MNPHMYYTHILLLLFLWRIFSFFNQKLSLVRALKIVSYMLLCITHAFSQAVGFAFNICLILVYKTSVKFISLPHESRCVLHLLIKLFIKKVLISLMNMRFMRSPKTDMTETLRRQLFPHQTQRFESPYSS